MAYQTGQVVSAAGLVAAIQTFAQANGWTLTGSVLSAGDAYVRIQSLVPDAVDITAFRGGVETSPDASPRNARIAFATGEWPASATYHMFAHSNPRTIWITMIANVVEHFHMGFGELNKYGTWNGGQWFHAQHSQDNYGANCFSTITGARIAIYGGTNECGLFWSQKDGRGWDSNSRNNKCSFLECDLRGYIWEATGAANDKSDLNAIHCPTIIEPIQRRHPNNFNGQTVLHPFELFIQNTDGHYMNLGHVGHIRFLKLTNYNPGDILEIGAERWMVFPWYKKDTSKPDGKEPTYSDGSFSTGVLGCAVRYDGP